MSNTKRLLAFLLVLGLVGVGVGRPTPLPAQDNKQKNEDKKTTEESKTPTRNSQVSRAISLADHLAKTVNFGGVDDPKSTIAEMIDQFRRRYDLEIQMNTQAFKAAEVDNILSYEFALSHPVPAMKAPLSRALRTILARIPGNSPAMYVIRGDYIELTTEAAVRAELGKAPGAPLFPLVLAAFDKVPLSEALDRLAQFADYNVTLDSRVGDKSKMPVSTAFKNVPLDTAVFLLADMADLAMVQKDNVLYVTTPDNAARIAKERGQKK